MFPDALSAERLAGLASLVAVACLPASVAAQEGEGQPTYAELAEENRQLRSQLEDAGGPNLGRISLDLGADVTSHYFFRGTLQEDQGFIVEPYANVGFEVFEGSGAVDSVTFSLGIWNSFHEEETGAMTATDGADAWYEADLSAGVSAVLFDDWEAGVDYIAYTSPNDAFDTIQEIDLSVSYDDSELLGNLAMSPSAVLAFETDNTLLGTDPGSYLGINFGPRFEVINSEDYFVTMSVPVTVGLSLENYYEDANDEGDNFGFARVGLDFSMPLGFVPEDFGEWTVHAGPSFMFLGETNEALNNGDQFEIVGTVGVNITY